MIQLFLLFFFFFSSRRRHTRFDCDWSSDVCSSDLRKNRCNAENAGRSNIRYLPRNPRLWNSLHMLPYPPRSEEHTSELQSQSNLVCRLLLEKKKKIKKHRYNVKKNRQ